MARSGNAVQSSRPQRRRFVRKMLTNSLPRDKSGLERLSAGPPVPLEGCHQHHREPEDSVCNALNDEERKTKTMAKSSFTVKTRSPRMRKVAAHTSLWTSSEVMEHIVHEDDVPRADEPQLLAAGRSPRLRRESIRYAKDYFKSTTSAEFDWLTFYPDTPYVPDPTQVASGRQGYINMLSGDEQSHENGNFVLGEVLTLSPGSSSDSEGIGDLSISWGPHKKGRKDRKVRKITFKKFPDPIARRSARREDLVSGSPKSPVEYTCGGDDAVQCRVLTEHVLSDQSDSLLCNLIQPDCPSVQRTKELGLMHEDSIVGPLTPEKLQTVKGVPMCEWALSLVNESTIEMDTSTGNVNTFGTNGPLEVVHSQEIITGESFLVVSDIASRPPNSNMNCTQNAVFSMDVADNVRCLRVYQQHMTPPTFLDSRKSVETPQQFQGMKVMARKKKFTPKVKKPEKSKVPKTVRKVKIDRTKSKTSHNNGVDGLVAEKPKAFQDRAQDSRNQIAKSLQEKGRIEEGTCQEPEYLHSTPPLESSHHLPVVYKPFSPALPKTVKILRKSRSNKRKKRDEAALVAILRGFLLGSTRYENLIGEMNVMTNPVQATPGEMLAVQVPKDQSAGFISNKVPNDGSVRALLKERLIVDVVQQHLTREVCGGSRFLESVTASRNEEVLSKQREEISSDFPQGYTRGAHCTLDVIHQVAQRQSPCTEYAEELCGASSSWSQLQSQANLDGGQSGLIHSKEFVHQCSPGLVVEKDPCEDSSVKFCSPSVDELEGAVSISRGGSNPPLAHYCATNNGKENSGDLSVQGNICQTDGSPATPKGNSMSFPSSREGIFPVSPVSPLLEGTVSMVNRGREYMMRGSMNATASCNAKSVRRSLLPEFVSAKDLATAEKNQALNDNSKNRILEQPIPFSSMNELQQEQYVWALCKDKRSSKKRSDLSKAMTRSISEDDAPRMASYITRLTFEATDADYNARHGSEAAMKQNIQNQLQPMDMSEISARYSSDAVIRQKEHQILLQPMDTTEISAQSSLDAAPRQDVHQILPQFLDTSEMSAKDLQVVPYGEELRRMVLYQDPLLWRRKLKYKPKVVLDSDTVKLFKRLMLKGGAVEDADLDEAKWEQTRQEWRIRTNSFNAVMRQIQGDRAFSKWGGSVLDSVGGTFLTQNVSDFLSSMAFMALRANFPARGRTTKCAGTSSEEEEPSAEEIHDPWPDRPTRIEPTKKQMEEEHKPMEALIKVDLLDSSEGSVCTDTALDQPDILPNTTTSKDMVIDEAPGVETFVDGSSDEVVSGRNTANVDRVEPVAVKHSAYNSLSFLSNPVCMSEALSHINSTKDRITLDPSNDLPQVDVVEEFTTIVSEGDKLIEDPMDEELLCTDSETLIQAEGKEEVVLKAVGINSTMESAEIEGGLMGCPAGNGGDFAMVSQWEGHPIKIHKQFQCIAEENLRSLMIGGRERVIADYLRIILGKKIISSEAGSGECGPLDIERLRARRRKMRNKKKMYSHLNKFQLRLQGPELARWEESYVVKSQKEKWEPLRNAILADENFRRDSLAEDCVDWEAVRCADVAKIADVIKERGMNNILAGRIKALLERLHCDQNGSLDLEWIRNLPPEDAKDFLLSVRGLGLKSVECIRLLSLHHPSFPVDTNVGRIVVRLGWVPLEPLPEETQLHLLELYPVQAHIQQYLWPRLCMLDQQTLYEFHYQLITFGKVFCTKRKPNCNACPMRSECKHFASAYSSAKPLLKGPEAQAERSSTMLTLLATDRAPPLGTTHPNFLLNLTSEASRGECIPIIEEPSTPEAVLDIEDFPFSIDLNYPSPVGRHISNMEEEFSIENNSVTRGSELECIADKASSSPLNKDMLAQVVLLEESMKDMDVEDTGVATKESEAATEDVLEEPLSRLLVEGDRHVPSQELILLPPQASYYPAPQLKNIQRLRTIHYVYELPDDHPLLTEMDKREVDDPCLYLLAIWNPDEVPELMPKINDDDVRNPFASCHHGEQEDTVRGTLLVPCRTAMKGSFPLNGTYFQVNEVFADHASSILPIEVPRTLLWCLRRRFVYFGTSVTSLFIDMSQEEIQCCFKRGYVCVRAFDQTTRHPKILAARLHQSGAKIVTAHEGRKGRRPYMTKGAHIKITQETRAVSMTLH